MIIFKKIFVIFKNILIGENLIINKFYELLLFVAIDILTLTINLNFMKSKKNFNLIVSYLADIIFHKL